MAGDIALPSARSKVVYFLSGADLIKIGTTTNLKHRLADLQSMSPVPVRLLGWIDGHRGHEMRLHERFKADRVYGEWFKESDALKSFITTAVAS